MNEESYYHLNELNPLFPSIRKTPRFLFPIHSPSIVAAPSFSSDPMGLADEFLSKGEHFHSNCWGHICHWQLLMHKFSITCTSVFVSFQLDIISILCRYNYLRSVRDVMIYLESENIYWKFFHLHYPHYFSFLIYFFDWFSYIYKLVSLGFVLHS